MTASGRPFWPMDPRPEDIFLSDIAHHLSLECRFGGACAWHYSVAQHSISVSRLVSPENALWGLLHDAAEAYLKDIPRPLKVELGNVYRNAEARVLACVAVRFGLAFLIPPEVHEVDNRVLMTERAVLLPKGEDLPGPWGPDVKPYSPGDLIVDQWDPGFAERAFLHRFKLLGGRYAE